MKINWQAFLKGMGNIFNLFPSYKTYEEQFGTDEERLASDWKKVGDDFRNAMEKF
ncbi:MAG: hypothetical protein HYY86_00395 [Candidatus Harrisonbacteria bacterium]|nr:hypothetical protein [Candidatus Harrisonbacteria bacterium]